ncbi:MAG: response regulator [Chloroflexi bacterium]|nr:response regulator [Chloroflexota bacterium]MBU1750470.1 response regulator [Chloroflexota bacterium]
MTEKKTRVLIVDDDPSLCRTLALILARKGHEVVTVEGGMQAVAAARQQPFDLILIDVLMPGQSGLDTLRELQAADPQARMVMMTGYAVAGLVAEAVGLGVDGVLYKPFDVEVVLNTLMSPDVLRLYQGYLQTVWDRIVPVVGDRTAQAVFSRAVQICTKEGAPLLAGVVVTESGISLESLRGQVNLDQSDELRRQLQALLAQIFDILGLLAGNILTDPLIERLSDRLKRTGGTPWTQPS